MDKDVISVTESGVFIPSWVSTSSTVDLPERARVFAQVVLNAPVSDLSSGQRSSLACTSIL